MTPPRNMNTTATHCVAGANPPRLSAYGENPPVGSVVNACVDRVVEVHLRVDPGPAEDREQRGADERQRDVEHPQPPRGVADRGRERLDLRAWRLRLEELAAADAQAREDRQREHDDPHASEPLRELPPEEQRAVDVLDVASATLAPVVVKPDMPSNSASTGDDELRLVGEEVRQRTRSRPRAATSARRRGSPRAAPTRPPARPSERERLARGRGDERGERRTARASRRRRTRSARARGRPARGTGSARRRDGSTPRRRRRPSRAASSASGERA